MRTTPTPPLLALLALLAASPAGAIDLDALGFDLGIDKQVEWPACSHGEAIEKFILRSSPVSASGPDGEPIYRVLWFDFKEVELEPANGPVSIALRAWLRPTGGAAPERLEAEARLVRMADGMRGRKPDSDNPKRRLGEAWVKPREGTEWTTLIDLDLTKTETSAIGDRLVSIELGPADIQHEARYTFVIDQQSGGYALARARATVCASGPQRPVETSSPAPAEATAPAAVTVSGSVRVAP